MNRFFEFCKRIYIFLIFILLELLVLGYYRGSSVYTRGKFHGISNNILSKYNDKTSTIREYFHLVEINDSLSSVNSSLREQLYAMEEANMRLIRGERFDTLNSEVISVVDSMDLFDPITGMISRVELDTLLFGIDTTLMIIDIDFVKDKYIPAKVVSNSIYNKKNYITLNRGTLDSVRVDYPVIVDDKIVGYIVSVSRNYSIAISMLNTDFKSSGRLKNSDELCSIFWDGESAEEINFSGISRYSDIMKGDTITTTGFSKFFAGGKLIGEVIDFELKDNLYYAGKLRPFTRFDRLNYVDIVFPENLFQRLELEDSFLK